MCLQCTKAHQPEILTFALLYWSIRHTVKIWWIGLNMSRTHKYFIFFRRFEADALANGIPYSKSGYRGSARLYSIEVNFIQNFMF